MRRRHWDPLPDPCDQCGRLPSLCSCDVPLPYDDEDVLSVDEAVAIMRRNLRGRSHPFV